MSILGHIDVSKRFYLLKKQSDTFENNTQWVTFESNYRRMTGTIRLQSDLLCTHLDTQMINWVEQLSVLKVGSFRNIFFFFFFIFIERENCANVNGENSHLLWLILLRKQVLSLSETKKIIVNLALFCFLLPPNTLYSLALVERTALENEERTRPMNGDNDNHNAKIFFSPIFFSLSVCPFFFVRDFSTTLSFTCSSIYRQNIGILKKNYNIFL